MCTLSTIRMFAVTRSFDGHSIVWVVECSIVNSSNHVSILLKRHSIIYCVQKKSIHETNVGHFNWHIICYFTVAFYATLNHNLTHLDDASTVIINNVITNEGNAYDGSLGVFTCTEPAPYVFLVTILVNRGRDTQNIQIVKNGIALGTISAMFDSDLATASGSAIINLIGGDNVWLKAYGYDRGAIVISNMTTFSGFCLGC